MSLLKCHEISWILWSVHRSLKQTALEQTHNVSHSEHRFVNLQHRQKIRWWAQLEKTTEIQHLQTSQLSIRNHLIIKSFNLFSRCCTFCASLHWNKTSAQKPLKRTGHAQKYRHSLALFKKNLVLVLNAFTSHCCSINWTAQIWHWFDVEKG